MVFSNLLRFWSIIPKRFLFILASGGFVYILGVSHGRAPFKNAALLFNIQADAAANIQQITRQIIHSQGRQAIETFKNNECVISADDADILSDIRAE